MESPRYRPKGVPPPKVFRIFDGFLTDRAAQRTYLILWLNPELRLYTRACTEMLYTVRPRVAQIDPSAETAWQSALGSSKIDAEEAWLSAGLAGRRV